MSYLYFIDFIMVDLTVCVWCVSGHQSHFVELVPACLPPSHRLCGLNPGCQACTASSQSRAIFQACAQMYVSYCKEASISRSTPVMCNYAPGISPLQIGGDLSISGINSWKENYRVKACASRFCRRSVSSEQHGLPKTSLAFSLIGSQEMLAVGAASHARWPQGVTETWRAELEGQSALSGYRLSGYRLSKSRKLGSG